MEIMKVPFSLQSTSVLRSVLALTVASAISASASEFPAMISLFGRKPVDPSIPTEYRRSFKTTRNDVVMVFDGTHWHSLSKFAVNDSPRQLQNFCDALTRSDRALAVIPGGFQYVAGGDGRVYLVKAAYTPMVRERSQPVVASKPRTVASASTKKRSSPAAPTPEVRKAVIPTAAAAAPLSALASDGSYHTTMGNVLMKPNGDQWEGRAPASVRDGLSAPVFCQKAAASDRIKGRLPSDYTYVLLADDTLLAVPKDSEIGRSAAAATTR